MSTFKQSQQFGAQGLASRMWQSAVGLAVSLGMAFAGGLARLAEGRAAVDSDVTFSEAIAMARAHTLFAKALHEDSRLESDWLWYAANITDDTQRRYCLQRALDINPDSDRAKTALARLSQR
jgi:hypothetical protein